MCESRFGLGSRGCASTTKSRIPQEEDENAPRPRRSRGGVGVGGRASEERWETGPSKDDIGQATLERRRPVGIPEHRVEAPGEVVGHVAGVVVLRGGHERRHPEHEQHQGLDGEGSSHHTPEEPVGASHYAFVAALRAVAVTKGRKGRGTLRMLFYYPYVRGACGF